MKTNIKKQSLRLCVIAITLIIGLSMTTCNNGSGGGGGRGGSSNTGDNSDGNSDDGIFTGSTFTSNSSEQVTRKVNGYDYELWNQNRKGNASMTLGNSGGGTYKCSWSGIENVLFRAGRKYNETQTHQQIGVFSIKYNAPVYSPVGNSYLSVYGWTVNPLVEFYIVDSWGSWRPPGAASKGQVTIDGGTYDIYETTRTQQPSIKGTQTFQQYWSVRTTKRTSGTISVTDHFNAWAAKGMNMSGKMYEVAFKVEGYQSAGSAEITENILSINGTPIK